MCVIYAQHRRRSWCVTRWQGLDFVRGFFKHVFYLVWLIGQNAAGCVSDFRWVVNPCIQSRSCRLQCYNPGSFKPSGRSNSHLSTRQSICASRGGCSLGSLASTLVLGFWAFQLTKKPFDPTVSEVHGGIDNVPVSLLLRMYNISQVSKLVSSCPGRKTQQDWHAPAMSSFPYWGARWRWRWLRGKPATATFVPTCFAVERGPAGSVLWPLSNSCGSCRSSRRGMTVQAHQLQDLEHLLV